MEPFSVATLGEQLDGLASTQSGTLGVSDERQTSGDLAQHKHKSDLCKSAYLALVTA